MERNGMYADHPNNKHRNGGLEDNRAYEYGEHGEEFHPRFNVCPCTDYRTACLIVAAYTWLSAMFFLIWPSLRLFDDWPYHFGVPLVMFIFGLCLLVAAALLAIGVMKWKMVLIIVWLCIYIPFTLYRLFLIIHGLFGLRHWADRYGTWSAPHTMLVILIILFIICLLLDIWSILAVLFYVRGFGKPGEPDYTGETREYEVVGAPYTDDPLVHKRIHHEIDYIRHPNGTVI